MRKAMEGRGLRAGLGPRTLLAVLAVLLMASAVAARADAYVYWANDQTGAIGRANLDGTGVKQSFIGGVGPGGAYGPNDVEVDSEYVYWVNYGTSAIGRASLSGTGVDDSFIPVTGGLASVVVDSSHIYWVNQSPPSAGTIGRANLDGTGVDQNFITTADNGPLGLAVDAGHVYWANQTADTIGRANLDGTGVNQNFITGIDRINSVAVDDDHVYWTEWSTDSVGRANLDGTGINPNFITGPWAPIDVAVDDSHVYWSDRGGCWIGRANLDGTGVSLTLITPGSCTGGIALDSGPPLAPTADAGADYETVSGAIAFLDGSGSADPDDDPLDYSWTQTSGPAVTVNGADTALASFVAPTGPATLEFELEVCDGEPLCDTDRIVVTIEAAPPTAMDDQATVDENSGATTIDVLDNDLDPGGPLEITSVTQPENGTVVIAPDGLSLTYEPAPDYCNEPGEQPTDDFTYTLNGGSEATVAVTVTCAEDPPDAPTITATTPGSPANNNSPTVRGTLGAGNPTEVLIFATANCREPTLARATAAEFTGTGIAITVPDNTTTPLSAMAIGESYSGCSNTISYIEDSSPPNTLIDSGPKGLTNNPSPSFAFHSPQPGVSFECRLDPSAGGTWAPCSSPKGYAGLAQGPHRFEVRAIDAAGNADPSPAVRTFNVDTIPPNTLIDSGPAGLTNNPSPSFAFHSPQPGVSFECRLDPSAGGTWAPCSSPKAYTGLARGPHRFEVRAIDAAGNTDPSPPVRAFNVQP